MADNKVQKHNHYPDEVKLRARELYLLGSTQAEVATIMRDEEIARLKKAGKKRPKVELIPPATISYWAVQGRWRYHRGTMMRSAEKRQLQRVRRLLTEQVKLQAADVHEARDLVRSFLYTPVLGKDGEPVRDESGELQLEKRDAGNSFMKTEDVAKLLLLVAGAQGQVNKQIADMLGDFVPKADLATLLEEEEGETE